MCLTQPSHFGKFLHAAPRGPLQVSLASLLVPSSSTWTWSADTFFAYLLEITEAVAINPSCLGRWGAGRMVGLNTITHALSEGLQLGHFFMLLRTTRHIWPVSVADDVAAAWVSSLSTSSAACRHLHATSRHHEACFAPHLLQSLQGENLLWPKFLQTETRQLPPNHQLLHHLRMPAPTGASQCHLLIHMTGEVARRVWRILAI